VPLPGLRAALERELGPPPGGTLPDEVALPLTQGERALLLGARTAAEAEGDDHIGPEHLLLAILADAEGPAARLLAAHGVDAAAATAAARVVIHEH
jgi:ATP-dependent Clp protease ATP-binding subunit ClpA